MEMAGKTYQSWHEISERNARLYPNKVFIESIDQGDRITFLEMNEWCGKVANFLKQQNISKNEKVTLIGKNTLETMILYFGILKYGAILNPIFSEESEENLYHIIDLAQPTLVFFDSERQLDQKKRPYAKWISFCDFFTNRKSKDNISEYLDDKEKIFREHQGEVNDIAELLYTSGTTSVPKGILISRGSLFLMTDEISERTGLTLEDKVLEYRAYNWASAQLLTILSSMLQGATLFLCKKFSRTRFPEWLKQNNITISSGVPAVFSMMLNEQVCLSQQDVPSLKFITSSSAPLPVDTHRKFENTYGIRINQMMGMSEAGWMAGNPPSARKIGSVGLPLKYKEIYFRNESGKRCATGEIGEMVVNGKSIGLCYLNGDGTRTEFPKDGFCTGDLGYMDEDGYIYITGRKKDLIIRGGINISPMEITSRMLEHHALAEAAAIGAPDKIFGEEVIGFAVKKEGFHVTEEEVIEHCRKSLPDFKTPKKILFLEALPRNQNGKVARVELIRMLGQKEIAP
jgi:acyl-coenzyme A synthetase/AMP-(fatty) acid ligase